MKSMKEVVIKKSVLSLLITALLGWYCTAMMVFALNLVLIQYAIAVGKRRYTWLGGLVTLGILLAISGWHSSLEQVITVMLVGNIALFLYCFLEAVRRGTDKKRAQTIP